MCNAVAGFGALQPLLEDPDEVMHIVQAGGLGRLDTTWLVSPPGTLLGEDHQGRAPGAAQETTPC
ncbi:hypothetical protein BJ956_002836 [Arthrobacter psychrochitiniphilus]|nr:hypothetical protein [Arthrobacter psychrochitiniphilus]